MPINANGLTTVARIKTFLGITVGSYDTLLERLINMVSDFTAGYCNRIFQEAVYTNEIYDGTGSSKLVLNNAPISTTATFTMSIRTSNLSTSSWDSIDSEVFHIDHSTGIIETSGWTFVEAPQRYRVTYTAGWAFDNFTPGATLESLGIGDLEYAAWKLIAKSFNSRKGNTNVQSENIGDYSVTLRVSAMTDKEIKEILDGYVRPHRYK